MEARWPKPPASLLHDGPPAHTASRNAQDDRMVSIIEEKLKANQSDLNLIVGVDTLLRPTVKEITRVRQCFLANPMWIRVWY